MEFGFIRNGVDIEQYQYADNVKKMEMKKKLGLPLDKIIVAYSGQFIERKDQEFAIKGILNSKAAEKVYMILMGDGPKFKQIRETYSENSLYGKNTCHFEARYSPARSGG